MGLSEGRESFRIGLAVLILYRSVTASHPASHVPVAITLNAKASSLKIVVISIVYCSNITRVYSSENPRVFFYSLL